MCIRDSADGLAAAQAASAAIADDQPGSISHRARAVIDAAPQADLAERATSLRQSLDEMDEPAAQAVLDRLFTDFTVETVFRDVLMPYLHELGARSVSYTHLRAHATVLDLVC